MDAEQAKEKAYPFDWPTPKRKQQRGKRRRKLASQSSLMTDLSQGLTLQHPKPHNAPAFDTSRAECDNSNDIGALAPCWAFFYAQKPSMAA